MFDSSVSVGRVVPSGVHWVADWGHGWLRVPVVSCEGLTFSEFSYVDRAAGVLYLEEDCDAGVWLRAHDVAGDMFLMEDHGRYSPVRELPRVQLVQRVRHSATCGECGRVFDLLDTVQASEWYYGHDCEAI